MSFITVHDLPYNHEDEGTAYEVRGDQIVRMLGNEHEYSHIPWTRLWFSDGSQMEVQETVEQIKQLVRDACSD